ncbi:MAG: metal ABC transporter permease [Candidatus Lambdaproteobacteria bacterium]|nr:metal ABC transporter permease [Candidatus Lambdaproteobacteria bacterium]
MGELFQYAFLQRALVAGGIVGVLCAVIGVFVVHRNLSFLGAGISHSAFGGVALGVLLGVNPVLAAIGFCLLVGWSIAWVSLRTRTGEDTAIGIFFASTMALGVLLISLSRNYQQDLFGYMFGSILAVTATDLWIISASAAVVLLALFVFGKELLFTIFDPEGAAVAGLPTERLYFLLITMITVTVVVSIKVVGIVLVSALLITPAAAASLLSRRFTTILPLAAAIGLGAAWAGLALSFWWNTPSGATIVLLVTVLFLLAALYTQLRARLRLKVRGA